MLKVYLFECDAEREQGYLCKFETLDSEGYADDCDAANAADYEVGQGEFPPEYDNPEDIPDETADACFVI